MIKYQDPDITFFAKLIKEYKGSFKKIINQIEDAYYVEESVGEVIPSDNQDHILNEISRLS
ncbi:MAG: hypothetical protein EBS33_02070 [Alphaproteobacteria bacterium]|nr:hypothetical protein [Alphaproteobacteria bacterium]